MTGNGDRVRIDRVSRPTAVFDTNVLIAALRSRRGASFRLLELVGTGRFELNLSVALALEYESISKRLLPTLPMNEVRLDRVLDFVFASSRCREIFYRWRPALPDPGDEMVLELAVAAGPATIVTFNGKDFQGADRYGVRVCEPSEFLAEVEEALP